MVPLPAQHGERLIVPSRNMLLASQTFAAPAVATTAVSTTATTTTAASSPRIQRLRPQVTSLQRLMRRNAIGCALTILSTVAFIAFILLAQGSAAGALILPFSALDLWLANLSIWYTAHRQRDIRTGTVQAVSSGAEHGEAERPRVSLMSPRAPGIRTSPVPPALSSMVLSAPAPRRMSVHITPASDALVNTLAQPVVDTTAHAAMPLPLLLPNAVQIDDGSPPFQNMLPEFPLHIHVFPHASDQTVDSATYSPAASSSDSPNTGTMNSPITGTMDSPTVNVIPADSHATTPPVTAERQAQRQAQRQSTPIPMSTSHFLVSPHSRSPKRSSGRSPRSPFVPSSHRIQSTPQ
jgi:hypothetical protein